MSNLAMVLLHSGRPEEALGLLEPAREIGQDIGDLEVQGVVANSLGTVYRGLGLYDQAIEMHRQCPPERCAASRPSWGRRSGQ